MDCSHFPGKSQVVDEGTYPSWGDDPSANTDMNLDILIYKPLFKDQYIEQQVYFNMADAISGLLADSYSAEVVEINLDARTPKEILASKIKWLLSKTISKTMLPNEVYIGDPTGWQGLYVKVPNRENEVVDQISLPTVGAVFVDNVEYMAPEVETGTPTGEYAGATLEVYSYSLDGRCQEEKDRDRAKHEGAMMVH